MNSIETREFQTKAFGGWLMLATQFLLVPLLGLMGYWVIKNVSVRGVVQGAYVFGILVWLFACLVWFVWWFGFFTLQPNIAAVLILFGKYKGTVHRSGFHWANPFLNKKKVSLRAHNVNSPTLKVNDARGSPIEISVVVVWRVVDSARAVFDVEDYNNFINIQSEAALRHLAMSYPYDTFEGDTLSLRGSVDEVSGALLKEVQDRVARAGVLVEETRISHLAYAAEIAGAMLQRQQAEAIVAARQRLVDGAVGMVEMALHRLEQHNTVTLDDERKAAMVSNLLVVLCGDRAVHPVVNAGSLY